MIIALEPLQNKHLKATYEWLQDPELRKQIDSLSAPPSYEVHEKVWTGRLSDGSRKDFAILQDGTHVGNCGLMHICLHRKKAELWIYVAEGKGRGVGQGAIKELLKFGFGELGLNKIYLRVLTSNPKACHFYEKCGFTKEGIARADTIHDGQFLDSMMFSMLKKEFN